MAKSKDPERAPRRTGRPAAPPPPAAEREPVGTDEDEDVAAVVEPDRDAGVAAAVVEVDDGAGADEGADEGADATAAVGLDEQEELFRTQDGEPPAEVLEFEVPSSLAVPPGPDSSRAMARLDPLQTYLREVQRHPLLTPDEEKRLTREYVQTQDVKVAARLVTANLRLVIKLAYEYRRAYKNIMDLIQEGNIGLMQAVKRYDPYRGVKLSSYAAWWIRAYMLRFILNNWRLVKVGTTQTQRKLFFNLNKQKAKLTAMGIEPTAKEIALRLGVQENDVVEMDRRLASGEASLDAPLGDSEGRAVARVETMAANDRPADETVSAEQFGKLVNEHLVRFRSTLKGKEQIIFDKRMVAEEPLTLQRLGDEFGVSRERVRQLEARLALRLRDYLKRELGEAVEVQ
ncbi:MAG: RNA polymerase factor sigma-32 [Myxococcales bacterium]|nr:RNA polymerase factor sigma-32 [Myxococcales bacterium]